MMLATRAWRVSQLLCRYAVVLVCLCAVLLTLTAFALRHLHLETSLYRNLSCSISISRPLYLNLGASISVPQSRCPNLSTTISLPQSLRHLYVTFTLPSQHPSLAPSLSQAVSLSSTIYFIARAYHITPSSLSGLVVRTRVLTCAK